MCNRTTGLSGNSCQPLTVHCVKLVIISSLKPRPVRRPSLPSPPPARAEAADGTLKQDVSVREVNLRRDGVANIMAGFIDTNCSDTSKSGPINLQAGGGVTGACEGAAALQHSDKCLFDLLYWRFRDAAAVSRGLRDSGVIGLFTLNIQRLQRAEGLNTQDIMMPKLRHKCIDRAVYPYYIVMWYETLDGVMIIRWYYFCRCLFLFKRLRHSQTLTASTCCNKAFSQAAWFIQTLSTFSVNG